MTLQELFNSEVDFDALLALGRQGLAWWVDELSAMLPDALRDRLSSRPRVWIEPESGGWRAWRSGRRIDLSPAAAARTRIGLLAAPEAVLVRDIAVPRLPAADVRRMVALDIDRLSPLAPELIHYDVAIPDRDPDGGRQRAFLAILPRTEATQLLDRAKADGYQPAALAVRSDPPDAAPRFDFLPQILAAEGRAPAGRTALAWRLAAVGLVLVNVAVLVGRDIVDVNRLRAATDAQAPLVQAVTRMRHRVEAEDNRRRALLARGRRGDPLRVIDVLTQALPAGAWAQHLEWNGQTLRIVGFARPDIDMAAAIRGTGAFANPRVLTSTSTTGSAQYAPFDITADGRPEPRP